MIRLPRFFTPRPECLAPVVLAVVLVFTPAAGGVPQLAPTAPSSQSGGEEERGGEEVVTTRPARAHAHPVPPAVGPITTRGAIGRRHHFDRSARTSPPARGPDGPYLRC